jgi:hypothetical protein
LLYKLIITKLIMFVALCNKKPSCQDINPSRRA